MNLLTSLLVVCKNYCLF